jgi:hypothetical protein
MNIFEAFFSRFNTRNQREFNDSEMAPQSLDKMDFGLGNGAASQPRFTRSRLPERIAAVDHESGPGDIARSR